VDKKEAAHFGSLFIDFSSAFDTIQPRLAAHKLINLLFLPSAD